METEGTKTCKNCGAISEGRFCPQCGQRKAVYKITFKETFQDLADDLFSVNAPLLITVRDMILRPGVLLRNYLNGKRKTYYRPVSFFILTTVFYLVIRALIDYDPFRNSMIVVEEGEMNSGMLTEARNYLLININNFLFVFVFTLAILMKLFFFRKYSLAEFLAIAFYLMGIYTLIVTINMFVVQFFGDQWEPVRILFMMMYFVYAISSLLKRVHFLVILKSIILFITAFMSYAIISYAMSYFIVSLKQS